MSAILSDMTESLGGRPATRGRCVHYGSSGWCSRRGDWKADRHGGGPQTVAQHLPSAPPGDQRVRYDDPQGRKHRGEGLPRRSRKRIRPSREDRAVPVDVGGQVPASAPRRPAELLLHIPRHSPCPGTKRKKLTVVVGPNFRPSTTVTYFLTDGVSGSCAYLAGMISRFDLIPSAERTVT